MSPAAIVQKLWNYCHVLRDDGMSYGDYVSLRKNWTQRRISKDDVRYVLEQGETIETYPQDMPYPSRLVLGWRNARPLHIVAADNVETGETIVITTYEPDPEEWQQEFTRRKPR